MKRKGGSFLFILLVLVVIAIIGKDFLIRVGVEQAVSRVTGLPLKIDSLKVGISTTLIDIKGMKLYNPPGFEEKLMVNIPEIYVDYNLKSLLTGKVHVSQMRLVLEEFIVVKNKEGAVNLNYLRTLQEKIPAQKPSDQPAPPSQEKKALPIQIDNLALKMKRVVYKDYSQGAEPVVKEIPLGIDQTYTNITDLNTVIGIIVVKAVAQTTIANLVGLDIGSLDSLVTGSLGTVTDSTKKILDETTGTIKNTTESLEKITDIFKKPFESK